jgi:hypothetical protein
MPGTKPNEAALFHPSFAPPHLPVPSFPHSWCRKILGYKELTAAGLYGLRWCPSSSGRRVAGSRKHLQIPNLSATVHSLQNVCSAAGTAPTPTFLLSSVCFSLNPHIYGYRISNIQLYLISVPRSPFPNIST